jgi:hypothetical protein
MFSITSSGITTFFGFGLGFGFSTTFAVGIELFKIFYISSMLFLDFYQASTRSRSEYPIER